VLIHLKLTNANLQSDLQVSESKLKELLERNGELERESEALKRGNVGNESAATVVVAVEGETGDSANTGEKKWW
jgi:hypothetical protein